MKALPYFCPDLSVNQGAGVYFSAAPGGIDTRTWEAGETIVDRRELQISSDARAGGYQILLSVYGWDPQGELQRLRVINSEGRILPEDTWVLGQIRVMPQ